MVARVFPAQAGVIPYHDEIIKTRYGIPRASGGDPDNYLKLPQYEGYSPRKRG